MDLDADFLSAAPQEDELLPHGVNPDDPVYLATRLVLRGLQSGRGLTHDHEYKRLVALWLADENGFRDKVLSVAGGLRLRIASVHPRFGIAVVPSNRYSPFAARMTDIREKAETFTVGALAIVQVAVAATFYPTYESLNDDAKVLPQRTTDVLRVLNAIIDGLGRADGDTLPSQVNEAWRELSTLPDRLDVEKRASARSREGLIGIVMGRLASQRQNLLRETSDSRGRIYHATYRYRVQVRDAVEHDLYSLCMRLKEGRPVTAKDGE